MKIRMMFLMMMLIPALFLTAQSGNGGNGNSGDHNRRGPVSTTVHQNNSFQIRKGSSGPDRDHNRDSRNESYQYISGWIRNTSELESVLKEVNRDLKMNSPESWIKTRPQILELIIRIETELDAFQKQLTESQTESIEKQIRNIHHILSFTKKIIADLPDYNGQNQSEIYDLIRTAGQNLNHLNRQFRAIRWILYENQ
jgi:hypothetical protein